MLSTTTVNKNNKEDNNPNIFIKHTNVENVEEDKPVLYNVNKKNSPEKVIDNNNKTKILSDIKTHFEDIKKTETDIFDNTNYDTIIEYSQNNNEFNIYDKDKTFVGSFKSIHIIKLVGKTIDLDFMGDKNAEYLNSIAIIKNIIFKTVNKEIILYDFTESSFMGNIQMLIKLNHSLEIYENDYLNSTLDKYSPEKKRNLLLKIQEAMYKLLIHTLKLLSLASVKIKKNSSLGKLIINYSIYISGRIDKWVKYGINDSNKSIMKIETTLDMCKNLREDIKKKLDESLELIKNQNNELVNTIQQLKQMQEKQNVYNEQQIAEKNVKQHGGKKSESSTNISNSSTSSYSESKTIESLSNKSKTIDSSSNKLKNNKSKKYLKSETSNRIKTEEDTDKIIAL